MFFREKTIFALCLFFCFLAQANVVYADATTQPLLSFSDLSYLGSFKMPSGDFGMTNGRFNYSTPFMFGTVYNDPTHGKTIYATGYLSSGDVSGTASIAQVSIPATLANPSVVGLAGLTEATVVRGFRDPSSGINNTILQGSTGILNGIVHNNKLLASAAVFYDAGCNQAYSGWASSTNIDSPSATGPYYFSGSQHPRLKGGGYMGSIPPEWQTLLGGEVFSGNGPISIISCASLGPSFFVIDADAMAAQPSSGTTINTTALLHYDPAHRQLGEYSSNSCSQTINGVPVPCATTVDPYGRGTFTHPYIDGTSKIQGAVFVDGTRTVLFFGTKGLGAFCYGDSVVCGDPQLPYSGGHAYPYIQYIWAYDANELLAVKTGTKSPWQVSPYAGWPFAVFGDDGGGQPTSVSWDAATRRLYVGVSRTGDDASYSVSVYSIASGASDTTPPSTSISTSDPSAISSDSLTIAGTASDGTGVSGCKWRIGSAPDATHGTACTGTTSFSCATSGYSSGSNSAYVGCHDAAGNYGSDSITVNYTPSGCRTVNVSNLSELYAAFASEQNCDEIVVSPGTYTLNTTSLSVDAPNVTVRGSTGDRDDIVIRGDAMTAGSTIKSIFYFPQGAYGQNATIKDLTVGRVGWHAIFFNGDGSGNGTTIDNVRIYDTYEQMIKGAVSGGVGTSGVTVENSLFEYTSGQSPQYYTGGIDAHSASGWVIRNNEFRDIQSPSGSVAEHAVHLWSNTTFSGSNTVERNKIINCDRGIGIWNNTGVTTIRNNAIMHDGSGSYPDVGIDIQGSPGQRVLNNTVWIAPSGYYAAMEFRGAATTGSVITNNLTNKQIALFDGATGTKTTNVENAQSAWFVNVASDLHLASAVASVVNQGTAVSGLIDDFDGDARVNQPDIGADEFSVSADTTPPAVTIATADPSTISADSLTVTGTASDAVGVSGCKWRIGSAPNASNGTACTGTTSFSCATSGYSDGANTLYVGCYDAAGNYGSDYIAVNRDSISPTTPTDLDARSNSQTSVDLSWGASTDAVGVASYRVDYCSGFGCSSWATLGTSPTNSYTHTGITPASNPTIYRYRVYALDAANNLSGAATSIHFNAIPTIPAFPGAEGGGAASKGGRGGTVYRVNSLSGGTEAGTLRACAVVATGPRTCVFDVGGTIELTSHINVSSPYLTIAGETAPGGGITISGKNSTAVTFTARTHNIIVRGLRFRKGYNAGTPAQDGDSSNVTSVSSTSGPVGLVIFDHVTVSWGQDENAEAWSMVPRAAKDITYQWSMIYEPLLSHPVNFMTGAYASSVADNMTDIDIHHSMLANSSHRNPMIKNRSFRFVNSLVYNWSDWALAVHGSGQVDIIGNKFKTGPLYMTESAKAYEIEATPTGNSTTATTGTMSLYVAGNVGPHNADPLADNWVMTRLIDLEANGSAEIGPLSESYRRLTPLPALPFPITAHDVATAETIVLAGAGASRRLDCSGNRVSNRDSADARAIAEYTAGNAGIVPVSEDAVGGYPTLSAGTACTDTDGDGMPDAWENANGLNPASAADGATLHVSGYSNLEMYLAGSSDATPPVLSGLSPAGSYPKTSTSVSLGATTDENATCRHGSAGSAWASKTPFSSTGSTSHSATLAVWAGMVKRICYQCRDALLNESAESCTTFSVSAKPKVGGFN